MMQDRKLSLTGKLTWIACLVFDLAVLIAFFKIFALFSLLAPVKSVLMLLVLLVGLLISNVAIAFPRALLKRMNIAHSASIIVLLLMYAMVSNLFSIFLIVGSPVWYIVWELLILAAFIGLFSIIAFFAKRRSEDMSQAKIEQETGKRIHIQLMEIEAALTARRHDSGMSEAIDCFAAFKERLNASTPFQRITNNHYVTDVENRIRDNLATLQNEIAAGGTDSIAAHLQALIEETRKLVIHREQLIIR